jgi:hypothetical protein
MGATGYLKLNTLQSQDIWSWIFSSHRISEAEYSPVTGYLKLNILQSQDIRSWIFSSHRISEAEYSPVTGYPKLNIPQSQDIWSWIFSSHIAQTCIKIVEDCAENFFQRLQNDSIIRVMFCIHIIVLQLPADYFHRHCSNLNRYHTEHLTSFVTSYYPSQMFVFLVRFYSIMVSSCTGKSVRKWCLPILWNANWRMSPDTILLWFDIIICP